MVHDSDYESPDSDLDDEGRNRGGWRPGDPLIEVDFTTDGGYGSVPPLVLACPFDCVPPDILRLLLLIYLSAMDRRLAWGVCRAWNATIVLDVCPRTTLNRRQRDEQKLLAPGHAHHISSPWVDGYRTISDSYGAHSLRVRDRLISFSARDLFHDRDEAKQIAKNSRTIIDGLNAVINRLQNELTQSKLPYNQLVTQLADPLRAGLLMEHLQGRAAERRLAEAERERTTFDREVQQALDAWRRRNP